MKHVLSFLLSLFLIVCISGCSERLGDFTLLSTKNVELGAKYEKIGTAEAKDEIIVFFIPLGQPDIEVAVDNILNQNQGDLLTNIVITNYNYSFFFGVIGCQVKGDVWRRVSLVNYNPSKEYYELSKSGKELYLVSCKDPVKVLGVNSKQR